METGTPSTRRPLPEGESGRQTRSRRRGSSRGSRRAACHDAVCTEGAPLTDEEWEMVEPLLARKPPAGRPYNDHRTVVGGIMWVARTGSSWREMPEEFGRWETAYRRYELWLRQGLWQRILEALGEEALLGPATTKTN
jgi:transposase